MRQMEVLHRCGLMKGGMVREEIVDGEEEHSRLLC